MLVDEASQVPAGTLTAVLPGHAEEGSAGSGSVYGGDDPSGR